MEEQPALNGTIEPITCEVPVISDPRRYMAIFGTSLSAVSLLCNLLIAIVLMKSKHSHFFFFALLAISDTFMSLMYGPVVAMEVMKDVIQELWVNQVYWVYMPFLLAASNITMTFSTLLIILATMERFLITIKAEGLRWFRTHRGFLAGVAFFIAFLFKVGMYFEIELKPKKGCNGTLMERELDVTSLTQWFPYGVVFKFYTRQIVTVLFPFIFLIFLNTHIVMTLRRQQRAAVLFRFSTSSRKVQVRSATRLTVLIVFSFLISNALNVFFTIVEFWDYDWLLNEENYQLYEYGTDCVSVMYIFVCATRLLVYVTCNEEIRNEVKEYLCGLCGCDPYTSRKGFKKQTNNASKGTSDLDSIALSIARRFIVADLTETTKMNDEDNSDEQDDAKSPIEAIVIANGYTHCNSDDV